MKPAIEIENLSKKFRIDQYEGSYLSLRDSIKDVFKRKRKEDFYALKDINFSVNVGDSIGIIGRNGAGKSTLLKIISKITPPTTGNIIYRGRVASLLEVGTGFHAELTGRENIFMNGSILGMKRQEIKRNFDAIVDFAGVERFLDTPLKHYSSGMQVRLAFAVAAFLENEILIVDEVLAVGDAEFQKKCIGKMGEVSKSGRTVVFVSHDMESVSTLCNKVVLLNKGQIQDIGDVSKMIQLYTNNFKETYKVWEADQRPGDHIVKLNKVEIVNEQHQQIHQPDIKTKFGIRIQFEVFENQVSPTPNYHFYSTTGVLCFVSIAQSSILDKGVYESVVWVPANFLNNQSYLVGVAMTTLKNVEIHLYEKEIIHIEVIESMLKRQDEYAGHIPGLLRPSLETKTIRL